MSLRDELIHEIGRVAYQWGEDEPNRATGHLLVAEAGEILDAILAKLDANASEWEQEVDNFSARVQQYGLVAKSLIAALRVSGGQDTP